MAPMDNQKLTNLFFFCLILNILTLLFVLYIYHKLRNKQGPPGPRGEPGPRGDAAPQAVTQPSTATPPK
jgi:hypothetical protein